MNTVRSAVRACVRAAGIDVKRYSPLARAVDILMKTTPRHPTFVQIGANNGFDFDDFYEVATRNALTGIVVEPVPKYYESLRFAYERHPKIRAVNVALHPTASSMPIYMVKPERATRLWQHGLASFNLDHVLGHPGVTEDMIIEQEVECLSFSELIARHLPTDPVDILAIDTEGFDGEILKMIDWTHVRPQIIRFEHKHMSDREREWQISDLQTLGYRTITTREDCTAVRNGLGSRLRYFSTMAKA